MKLTTQQVAEKLGVSNVTVATLARQGKLPTINKADGKRVAHRFDSKVVAEFKKTYAPIGGGRNRRANGHAATPVTPGLLTLMVKRLSDMDAKLDQLIGMWS